MIAKGQQIASTLKAIDPAVRVVLVFGRDDGLVREYAATIGKQIVEDLSDPFNVARPSSEQIKATPSILLDEVSALSMLGGRRLVRLENAGNDSKDAVSLVLESDMGDGLLVITSADLTKTSGLRKLVEGHKKGLAIACFADDMRDIMGLVRQILADANLTATQDAISYLSNNLGSDRAVSRGELDKLVLYMGNSNQQITLADAEACVGDTAALMLNHIAEATTGGNLKQLETVLERAFTASESPVAILRIVSGRLMKMHMARGSMDHDGIGARAAVDRMRPPVFYKEKDAFTEQLQRWPLGRITQALNIVADAEADCKTTGLPAETIAARTCLRVARAAR